MSVKDTPWEPHHREIATRWRPLVEVAGLHSTQHGPDHTFMLATAILRDPVVSKRVQTKADGAMVPGGAAWEVVNAMTDGEKEALQRRIIEKYKAKVVAQ